MPDTTATARVRHAELHAVVIRKDGVREDLGIVAKSHYSRFERLKARAHRRKLGRIHLGA